MTGGKAFLIYTSLRLALLLAVGGLLYLTGARGLLLLVLAFLVSGVVSLVLLDRPRRQMSAGLGRSLNKVNERIDRATTAEDVDPSAEAEAEPEAHPEQQQSN